MIEEERWAAFDLMVDKLHTEASALTGKAGLLIQTSHVTKLQLGSERPTMRLRRWNKSA